MALGFLVSLNMELHSPCGAAPQLWASTNPTEPLKHGFPPASCSPFYLIQPQILVWLLSCLPSALSTHLSDILSKNDVHRKCQQFHADWRGLGWWHHGKPQPETEGKWLTGW